MVVLMPPSKNNSGLATSMDDRGDEDISKSKINTFAQTTNANSAKSLLFPALPNIR